MPKTNSKTAKTAATSVNVPPLAAMIAAAALGRDSIPEEFLRVWPAMGEYARVATAGEVGIVGSVDHFSLVRELVAADEAESAKSDSVVGSCFARALKALDADEEFRDEIVGRVTEFGVAVGIAYACYMLGDGVRR